MWVEHKEGDELPNDTSILVRVWYDGWMYSTHYIHSKERDLVIDDDLEELTLDEFSELLEGAEYWVIEE